MTTHGRSVQWFNRGVVQLYTGTDVRMKCTLVKAWVVKTTRYQNFRLFFAKVNKKFNFLKGYLNLIFPKIRLDLIRLPDIVLVLDLYILL